MNKARTKHIVLIDKSMDGMETEHNDITTRLSTSSHPSNHLSYSHLPSFLKLFLKSFRVLVVLYTSTWLLPVTVSQGCGEMGGRQLDPRTQKLHAHKDKARLVELASDAAEHAIEDQLEAIRLHLACSTPTDNVSSSPSTVLSGRMWTYAPRESLPDTVTQLISRQPIQLPIETLLVISLVDWVKSNLL